MVSMRKVAAAVIAAASIGVVGGAIASPADAYVSPCLHNDNGLGGDLCVHFDANLQGAYYAWPDNINYTGGQTFPNNGGGHGYNWAVYHEVASADNFANNQNAKVCTGTYGSGTCQVVTLNWHANMNGITNLDASGWWI